MKRNNPKQDERGHYLPNGQSRKSGLSLSWADAAFGQSTTNSTLKEVLLVHKTWATQKPALCRQVSIG
ncbi:MAG: hypothetical protein QNJ55_34615 [Xenococcus sp. MO_188.B8]|nr:hypothetical protein [Xenococcus sp. MO_188.B8]